MRGASRVSARGAWGAGEGAEGGRSGHSAGTLCSHSQG